MGKKLDIPPEYIAKLGVRTDKEIAHECGVSIATIRSRRIDLGIPVASIAARTRRRAPRVPAGMERTFVKWEVPPEFVPMLGVMTDTEIARACGVAQATVSQRRNALGIPPATTQGSRATGKRGPNKRIAVLAPAKAVVESARAVLGGMLVPFDLFTRLAEAVFLYPSQE
jgi:hypothetical protein